MANAKTHMNPQGGNVLRTTQAPTGSTIKGSQPIHSRN
jgi:hypothetical protein